jgi:hypothetical protein
MKIRPVGTELFHTDSQVDITKLIAEFRNFTKAPKISAFVWKYVSVCNILLTLNNINRFVFVMKRNVFFVI